MTLIGTTMYALALIVVVCIHRVASETSVVVGNHKITALSTSLLRIEPKGPVGFENRSTFNIVGRDQFEGIDIQILNSSASDGTWLGTSAYVVHVPLSEHNGTQCDPQVGMDAKATRMDTYPKGLDVHSAEHCCEVCNASSGCVGWTFSSQGNVRGSNCWPFSSIESTYEHAGRTFGSKTNNNNNIIFPQVAVYSLTGKLLWNGTNTGDSSQVEPNLLHWPAPLDGVAYAFTDHPRFTVPPWGPTPIPNGTHVDPEILNTNGYDFRNDIDGDTYIFLLGDSLDDWYQSRGEFLDLTGPTPLLPDFAYGIWYTWYIAYTESRAKDEIGNWTEIKLPLDVWALDMNWREINTNDRKNSENCRSQTNNDPKCRDHFYNHPNLELMPGLESPTNEWFDYIKSQNLKTYFNDHPFPLANQTTPEEVAFRYQGLSEWIGRGLSYWWFDHNWAFTLPGPRMPFDTKGDYEGLSGAVWGSHVYFESTKHAYQEHNIEDRPIALSRDNGPNWKTANPMKQTLEGAGSVAHHRYPVWWTGDGVPLMASVESMVNEAVHDFRTFVHSDCGGHGSSCPGLPENASCPTPNDQALLRWTAHCTFGTIMRFHQGDHRFWLRDNNTQTVARNYLNMRHKLAPSLIAAGRLVQDQGFPLTARCDLIWPDHKEAKDPTQYIHLNSTLVAPLDVEPVDNMTSSRSVWIPPGDWIDGWTGAAVSGPQTMMVSRSNDKIPIWHKRGSVLVTDATPDNLRIVEQDWSQLTIEAFPSATSSTEHRNLFEQEASKQYANAEPTVVSLITNGEGKVTVTISQAPTPRSWTVRLHLSPGQTFKLDSNTYAQAVVGDVTLIYPTVDCHQYFPLQGKTTAPPCQAGPVAEFVIAATDAPLTLGGILIN